MVSQQERLLEQILVKSSFQSEARMVLQLSFKRLSDDPSSNSLVAIKSLFLINGDSHPW